MPGQLDPACRSRAYRALCRRLAFGVGERDREHARPAAPLILGGLAVGLGFKAGLFNIGAQGQFLLGRARRGRRGRRAGAPAADRRDPARDPRRRHCSAGLWGFIPGFLKAFTGAHEVVTTIMLNYVAIPILAYGCHRAAPRAGARSPGHGDVGNAVLPILIGRDGHLGILVALVAACRSSSGSCTGPRSASRSGPSGANPDAARYAGMGHAG